MDQQSTRLDLQDKPFYSKSNTNVNVKCCKRHHICASKNVYIKVDWQTDWRHPTCKWQTGLRGYTNWLTDRQIGWHTTKLADGQTEELIPITCTCTCRHLEYLYYTVYYFQIFILMSCFKFTGHWFHSEFCVWGLHYLIHMYLSSCFSVFEQLDTQWPSSSTFPNHNDHDPDQSLKTRKFMLWIRRQHYQFTFEYPEETNTLKTVNI